MDCFHRQLIRVLWRLVSTPRLPSFPAQTDTLLILRILSILFFSLTNKGEMFSCHFMEAINLTERLATLSRIHIITYAKQRTGGVGGTPLSLRGSNALKKTCISAEIHIGKWISHLKHCFSLREAFNPLKFLSNLPWKRLSQAYNSDDITDLIY